MNKGQLRRDALQKRRALSSPFRTHAAQAILDALMSDEHWGAAVRIGCYVAMPDEVPTRLIIEQALQAGKQVAVPFISPNRRQMAFHQLISFDQLARGPLGILQPKNPAPTVSFIHQDLMLIPGIAFDTQANRLGMGKGFYDRYLPGCPARRYGMAFDIQVVSQLPCATHDIPMDKVLTEKRIILQTQKQ